MIDNLGSKLGSFDRVESDLADGESWSAFDKGIGAGAYFGAAAADSERAAA
jgi:3'-5' exoribonuclease